ncbi:hypothetical protein KIPB_012691, partial [Kipferlia bialata]|eukprot:g12691.t1
MKRQSCQPVGPPKRGRERERVGERKREADDYSPEPPAHRRPEAEEEEGAEETDSEVSSSQERPDVETEGDGDEGETDGEPEGEEETLGARELLEVNLRDLGTVTLLDGYLAAQRAGHIVAIREYSGSGFVYWVRPHTRAATPQESDVESSWKALLAAREAVRVLLQGGDAVSELEYYQATDTLCDTWRRYIALTHTHKEDL